jgi:Transposase domain (DUF772)
MALGRQGERQADLMIGWAELPRSPGHAFYDRLQAILTEAGFDGFAESRCKPHYASGRGRPSLPPGRYFRMHLVGYFEGIDSERGLEWRCSDSLSLREFRNRRLAVTAFKHGQRSRAARPQSSSADLRGAAQTTRTKILIYGGTGLVDRARARRSAQDGGPPSFTVRW